MSFVEVKTPNFAHRGLLSPSPVNLPLRKVQSSGQDRQANPLMSAILPQERPTSGAVLVNNSLFPMSTKKRKKWRPLSKSLLQLQTMSPNGSSACSLAVQLKSSANQAKSDKAQKIWNVSPFLFCICGREANVHTSIFSLHQSWLNDLAFPSSPFSDCFHKISLRLRIRIFLQGIRWRSSHGS